MPQKQQQPQSNSGTSYRNHVKFKWKTNESWTKIVHDSQRTRAAHSCTILQTIIHDRITGTRKINFRKINFSLTKSFRANNQSEYQNIDCVVPVVFYAEMSASEWLCCVSIRFFWWKQKCCQNTRCLCWAEKSHHSETMDSGWFRFQFEMANGSQKQQSPALYRNTISIILRN